MDRRRRQPRRRPRRCPRRQPVSDLQDWAHLPAHVLDLISLDVSSLPDYIAFSHVCRQWYQAAKSNESKKISDLTTPMLLIPAQSKFSLFNLFTKKVLGRQLDLPEKRYCGSSIGWMIYVEKNMEDRFGVTLIKPFEWSRGVGQDRNTIIRLPPLPPLEEVLSENFGEYDGASATRDTCPDYHVFKASLSGDPILDLHNCTVVIIHELFRALAFCRTKRVRKSTGAWTREWIWTYVSGNVTGDEVVTRGDQLFVVDTDTDLFCVNIGVTPPRPLGLVEGPGDKSSQVLTKFYSVDVKDQGILMVERTYDGEGTRAFRVFQLMLDGKDWKLIQKEDLGDIALFVGGSSTTAVAASSVSGCLANHIYFLQDWNGITGEDAWRDDYGAYNLSIHLISKTPFRDAMYLIEGSRLPPIWLLPTLFLMSM